MRILVTGGTGFVGSNLVKALASQGHSVYVTAYEPFDYLKATFDNHIAGTFDKDLTKIKEQFDVVFHQAANNDTQDNNEYEMYSANVYEPIVMFHNLKEAGCRKFIYASSTAVYGNSPAPFTEYTKLDLKTPYARSKWMFDEFAMKFRKECQVVGLRYCNVYGPGEERKGKRMSMIGQIFHSYLNKKEIALFKDGEQKRDWVYIKDVVQANLNAMNGNSSGIYNIGSGMSISFKNLVVEIEKTLGDKLPVSWIDCPFEGYQTHTECDCSRAGAEFGYIPEFNLQTGLIEYYYFLRPFA